MTELRWIKRKFYDQYEPIAAGTVKVLQYRVPRPNSKIPGMVDLIWEDVPTVDEDGI